MGQKSSKKAYFEPSTPNLLPLTLVYGTMWKLLLILILVIYLLNKISTVLFRVMGRPQGPPPSYGRQQEGDINVNQPGKKAARKGDIKGGEYIDYEEVK